MLKIPQEEELRTIEYRRDFILKQKHNYNISNKRTAYADFGGIRL